MRPPARSLRALDLDRICRRALARAARAASQGNRHEIRAAASRFVRRHRRSTGFLRWVVRSVAANAALACALLGLAPQTVSAKATLFDPAAGAANPLAGTDVGSLATATLGDLDGDGDLDLVAGAQDGTFRFFANTGSATAAVFVERVGGANPLAGASVGFYSAPALADLDGDGDLDLVAGSQGGSFAYYANVGSRTNPSFVLRTGAANPLTGFSAGGSVASTLGDLDGDGDLDLVAGDFSGGVRSFENTGTRTSPAFVERTGAANPLSGQSVAAYAKPSLGDFDRDGDLDLVVGEFSGVLRYAENTGNASHPAFVSRPDEANPLAGQDVGFTASPAAGDLDRDGDLDLLIGTGDGTFVYDPNLHGRMIPRSGSANPLAGQDVGRYSAPALVDLDGDGDFDLVVGTETGGFAYFANTGSATSPVFVSRTGASNPLGAFHLGLSSAPAFGDLDHDGDVDLVTGEANGTFQLFENTGNRTTAAFAQRTGASNPLFGVDIGTYSKPTLGDLDGDGDLDLVAGAQDGTFRFFANTGSATTAAFLEQTGGVNPLPDIGFYSAPALADLDADGDLDVVVGDRSGRFLFFENSGSAASAAFVMRLGFDDPFSALDVGRYSAPTLADFDGDGDLDLLSGEYDGVLFAFESAIVDPTPSFAEVTGSRNPLDGRSGGLASTPALGDLDGDGDLDLVAGESGGTFRFFLNTRTATQPAFVQQTGSANPLAGQDVGFASTPALGDLDGDGDLDLVSGEANGTFRFAANTGNARQPAFVERTGAANPFLGLAGGYNPAPALGDLDGDGDLDLVAGDYDGVLRYFQNTGSATTPLFAERTGIANPFAGQLGGTLTTPALGDVDEDGKLDLVTGEATGVFRYFENVGSANVPGFVARTGAENPFAGKLAVGGLDSAPALGDVDHDGDLDLISGSGPGAFATFLPEPVRGALLTAGLVLLRGLERLRRRRRGE